MYTNRFVPVVSFSIVDEETVKKCGRKETL